MNIMNMRIVNIFMSYPRPNHNNDEFAVGFRQRGLWSESAYVGSRHIDSQQDAYVWYARPISSRWTYHALTDFAQCSRQVRRSSSVRELVRVDAG